MAASVNDICIELVMILTPWFIIYQQASPRISALINCIAGFDMFCMGLVSFDLALANDWGGWLWFKIPWKENPSIL